NKDHHSGVSWDSITIACPRARCLVVRAEALEIDTIVQGQNSICGQLEAPGQIIGDKIGHGESFSKTLPLEPALLDENLRSMIGENAHRERGCPTLPSPCRSYITGVRSTAGSQHVRAHNSREAHHQVCAITPGAGSGQESKAQNRKRARQPESADPFYGEVDRGRANLFGVDRNLMPGSA